MIALVQRTRAAGTLFESKFWMADVDERLPTLFGEPEPIAYTSEGFFQCPLAAIADAYRRHVQAWFNGGEEL